MKSLRMMTGLLAGFVGVLVGACTIQSDKLSVGDATSYYVAPALCEKQSACIPVLFSVVYPGGVAECKAKLLEKIQDKDKLSACTNDEYKACAADLKNAECPTDPAANGIPPSPSSCSKC